MFLFMYRSLYCSIGILISSYFKFYFILRIVLVFIILLRFEIVPMVKSISLHETFGFKTLKIMFSNSNRISLSWKQGFNMMAKIEYDAKNNIMLLSTSTD